jgi:2-oxoglutarate ferredoxin oxidoreductase subunit delta
MSKTKGAIVIDTERCKGCNLCVVACPTHTLKLAVGAVNHRGYTFCQQVADNCIGCASCAIVCPDACITVYKAKVE